MPVNPLLVQELINKYGVDKVRSAKDNIASRREQKMFDRVSEKIANQRLPGEINDEPLVPMEQEIMSYTDAGDPMQMYEAGQMVANGQVLPGVTMMGLTLAPQALTKGISKAIEKKVAESAAKKKVSGLKQYAKANGLGVGKDVGTGETLLMTWQGPMYLKDGKLEPVESISTAGSAALKPLSPLESVGYDQKAWENWLAGHEHYFNKVAGYPDSPATAFKYVPDYEADIIGDQAEAAGLSAQEYWKTMAEANAKHKADPTLKYQHLKKESFPNLSENQFNSIIDESVSKNITPEQAYLNLFYENEKLASASANAPSTAGVTQAAQPSNSTPLVGITPMEYNQPLVSASTIAPNEGKVMRTIPHNIMVSTPEHIQVQQILDMVNRGEMEPLETIARDISGDPVAIPDWWAAALRTDAAKKAYPEGVDYFWRGFTSVPGWQSGLRGYHSFFGGSHDLAAGYKSGFNYNASLKTPSAYSTEGGIPNMYLLTIPKGKLREISTVRGQNWSELFEPTPENITLMQKYYGNVPGVSGDYAKMTSNNPLILDGYKIHSTDDISRLLGKPVSDTPGMDYPGVVLRGIHDGGVGDEVIWNPERGGFPKIVHPGSSFKFALQDPTLLGGGGSIHIKPSHRGRLTELKKRTGKSEAELYNDGNPAHKKMVVFARNSRKWKHEDGGFLKNYFEDGGPEDGSVEKYISDRISEMRTAALENSRTRTDPAVPMVREYIDPKNTAALYNFCSQGYYSDADRNTTGLALYGKDGTVINTKVGVRQTKRAEEDYEKAIKVAKDFQDTANELYAASPYYVDVPGATCIYTATDNYGPSHRVSGNQTFAASPEKYGFVQIPMEDVQPGDIIQYVEYKDGARVPVHGMIYDGQDSEGNMLFNYSDGGIDSSAIKVGSRYYPFGVDANRHGNAFRFVGTPTDSLKWKQEYMNLNAHSDGGKIRGRRNGKFYVTELNDRREKKFQDWYANAAATLGLDPNPDAYSHAYDYRGYWLNNRDADVSSSDFHFPDTWKQPHHPTFSTDSVYAKGHDGVGHWEGDTFVPGPFNNLMQATEPTVSAGESPVVQSNYVPSDDILKYIKDTEAFRDQWYQDGNGVWTIGYGFTGDDVRKRFPNGMTQAEADQYFADTVSRRVPMFINATPNFDKLNQNQRDALFSYYYNIGHGGYTRKSPAMQEALKNFDLDTVVNNIDFGYNDKKNRGLRKRRDYERNLFSTPMDYGGILNRLRNVYGNNDEVKAAILRAKNVKKN